MTYRCVNGHEFEEPLDFGVCGLTDCAGHEACPICRVETFDVIDDEDEGE